MSDLSELILTWRKNPLTYAYNVFGITDFDDWQKQLLTSFPTHNRIAVKSGRSVGKSFMQSFLIFYFLSTRPRPKILVTSSTQSNLDDVVWAECRRLLNMMKPEFRELYDFEMTSEKIFPKQFNREIFASARVPRQDQVESVQGFRSDQTLIVADEASSLEQNVFQAMLGNLSGSDSLEQKFLLFSNPRRLNGPFYDIFATNKNGWKTMTVASTDSRWCSHEIVEEFYNKYGPLSPEYLSDILGEFPINALNTILTPVEFDAAISTSIPITDTGIWGLDVARFGTDKCALAKRYNRVLAEPVRTWVARDTMETADIVYQEYVQAPQKLKPHTIAVDTIGIGAGVYDRLKQLNIPCYPVNVATKSQNRKFRTLRDVLYFRAAEAIRNGFSLPNDLALKYQATRIEFDFLSSGQRTITTKDVDGKSPDEWDAFCLTFAPTEPLPDYMPRDMMNAVSSDMSYLGGFADVVQRNTDFTHTAYYGPERHASDTDHVFSR